MRVGTRLLFDLGWRFILRSPGPLSEMAGARPICGRVAFIFELVRQHRLKVRDVNGDEISTETCEVCGTGFLVPRKGSYGPFLGCTNYPRCRNTVSITTDVGTAA